MHVIILSKGLLIGFVISGNFCNNKKSIVLDIEQFEKLMEPLEHFMI